MVTLIHPDDLQLISGPKGQRSRLTGWNWLSMPLYWHALDGTTICCWRRALVIDVGAVYLRKYCYGWAWRGRCL